MSTPTVSIIIPTYNNAPVLARVLAAVAREIGPHEDVGAIVVDSSDDGKELRPEEIHPRMRSLRPSGRVLPGPARNLGAESTAAETLIFLDGDCIPAPGWLDAFLAARDRLANEIVCGAVDIDEPNNAAQFTEYLLNKLPVNSAMPPGSCDFVITENMMIHRQLFRRLGGFEGLDHANDAQFDAARRGQAVRLHTATAALVRHVHPRDPRRMLAKFFRTGVEQIEVIRTLPLYRFRRAMMWCFPFICVVRWLRLAWRLVRHKPSWLPRFVLDQPLILAALLLHQLGMWRGLFARRAPLDSV